MAIRNPNLGMVLRGIGVSPGIVLGNVYRIDDRGEEEEAPKKRKTFN